MGTILCYDIRFPELTRSLALCGAEIVFNLALWPRSRLEHQQVLAAARAIENQIYFVTCNTCGAAFAGCSSIIAPDGRIVVQGGTHEEVIMADLDLSLPGRWRREFPSISQARTDLFPCLTNLPGGAHEED